MNWAPLPPYFSPIPSASLATRTLLVDESRPARRATSREWNIELHQLDIGVTIIAASMKFRVLYIYLTEEHYYHMATQLVFSFEIKYNWSCIKRLTALNSLEWPPYFY